VVCLLFLKKERIDMLIKRSNPKQTNVKVSRKLKKCCKCGKPMASDAETETICDECLNRDNDKKSNRN